MQNAFYNQHAVDWAKRNLIERVVIKPFLSSLWGRIFIYLLLFSPALAFLLLGVLMLITRGFNIDAYRPFACGIVLLILFGMIALIGLYTQSTFAKSLDADGVGASRGRKFGWDKLYYVDHVSKTVRAGGAYKTIKDNQLELVFEGGKVIIPPLIHNREQIWSLINSIPVQVRDDGVVRNN